MTNKTYLLSLNTDFDETTIVLAPNLLLVYEWVFKNTSSYSIKLGNDYFLSKFNLEIEGYPTESRLRLIFNRFGGLKISLKSAQEILKGFNSIPEFSHNTLTIIK